MGPLGNVAADVRDGSLATPPYWFSAHLRCKFSAIKTYDPPKPSGESESTVAAENTRSALPTGRRAEANPDEVILAMDDEEPETNDLEESAPSATEDSSKATEDLRAKLPAAFAKPQ